MFFLDLGILLDPLFIELAISDVFILVKFVPNFKVIIFKGYKWNYWIFCKHE